jgi:ketosteroid isomerase-like protein
VEPIEVVTAFGDAWASHDLDATLALISEDCVFESTGPPPDGVQSVGKAAIRKAWQPIFEDASATFEPELTFASGEHVIQLWRYSWSNGHVRGVDVFLVRDDLVAEKRSYVKG